MRLKLEAEMREKMGNTDVVKMQQQVAMLKNQIEGAGLKAVSDDEVVTLETAENRLKEALTRLVATTTPRPRHDHATTTPPSSHHHATTTPPSSYHHQPHPTIPQQG